LGAFLATQFLGAFNDNAYRFTLLAVILASTQDPQEGRLLGWAQLLFALPFVIFSTWAGSLADRMSKSRLIVYAKAAEILVMGLGLAAFARGDMGVLLGVLFLMTTQSTFFGPAKYGYVAETVPEGSLGHVNGLVQLTTNLAIVGGQIAGGRIYEAYSDRLAQGALWFVGIAALGTLTSCFVRRVPASRPASRVWTNPLRELAAVWSSVRAHRTLLYAMLGIGHFWMVTAVLQIDLMAFGTEEFGLGPAHAAVLMGVAVIGIGAGSALAGRLSRGRVELGLVPLGALTLSLGILALALVPPLPLPFGPAPESGLWGRLLRGGLLLPFAVTFAMGVAGGLFIVPLMALVQWHAPEREKGRYLAFGNLVSFVGIGLASAFLWLPREVGLSLRHQLVVAAALSLCGTAMSFRLLPDSFIRLVGWLLAHTFYRIRVLHPERLPERGGALLVVNHVSFVDALILQAATRRQLHFLMYRAYYEWRPTRWLFRMMGCIPVAAGDAPEVVDASLQAAGRQLDEGHLVVVFAEGSLTRLGRMLPLRSGYLRIVAGRSVPIVPVHLGGLWGSLFSHERGRVLWKLPRALPYPVSVSVGASLPADAAPHQVRQALRGLAVEAWEAGRAERLPLPLQALRQQRRSLRRRLGAGGEPGLRGAAFMARATLLAAHLRPRLAGRRRIGVLAAPGQEAALALVALCRLGVCAVPLEPAWTLEERTRRQAEARVDGLLVGTLPDAASGSPPVSGSPAVDRAGVEAPAAAEATHGRAIADVPRWELAELLARPSRLSVFARAALHALLPWCVLRRLVRPSAAGGHELPCAILFSRDPLEPPAVLGQEQLLSTVGALQQALSVDRRRDGVLGLLPWTSAYGLVTTLWLPLVSGARVSWCAAEAGHLAAAGRAVKRAALTLLPATPALLSALVGRVRPSDLGSLRIVLSGEEALPASVSAAWKSEFGLEPLEALTATSCGGIVALNTPDVRVPGEFQQGHLPGSVGHPLERVLVDVLSPQGDVLPGIQQVGRLRVRGPCLGASLDARGEILPRDAVLLPRDGSLDARGFLHLQPLRGAPLSPGA